MAIKGEYRIKDVHLKSIGTKALLSGDSGTEIKFWVRNLTPEVLNFLNAIVGTPVNQAHELEIAIIGDEPDQGLNHG